ncbi:MAG: cytochrome c3 family protein [Akkermansia sp.]
MANIFPPHANRRFYGIIALGMLVLALILGGVYYLNFYVKEHTPVQPVRFSHKLHAGDLKMGCTSCHAAALRSPRAGIPDTKSCLGCHQHILPNSPLIAPLRAAADPQFPGYTGEPVRWVMVNRLSGHAYFNHMAHLNRGIGCTSCHEDAAGMEVMKAPVTPACAGVWTATATPFPTCARWRKRPVPTIPPRTISAPTPSMTRKAAASARSTSLANT